MQDMQELAATSAARGDTPPAHAPVWTVDIWRGADEGEFVSYEVPRNERQTVLDVVSWVQRHRAPDLAYRFACRVGMCGSCAMMVNERPRWTCRTQAATAASGRRLRLAPLRALPRIKDLVTDMRPFFERWREAGGHFEASATRTDPFPRVDPAGGARRAADAAIECINCAVCFSACDVVAGDSDYLGPAALNRAWTLVNDERHAARESVLRAVTRRGGCMHCHTQASCTEHCPMGLDPSASIAGLKRFSLAVLLGRTPW